MQQSPNHLNRVTARANLNITLSPNADLAINAGYIPQDLRLPRATTPACSASPPTPTAAPASSTTSTPPATRCSDGAQFTPRDIYQQSTRTRTSSASSARRSANWRPPEWLAVRGNFGLDYIGRRDTQLCRFAELPRRRRRPAWATRSTTARTSSLHARRRGHGHAAAHATRSTRRRRSACSSYRNVFDRNGTERRSAAPGATTVTGAAPSSSPTKRPTRRRTLGGFIEENVAFRDRLFVTGAVRSDRNSAFGANFKTVFYPEARRRRGSCRDEGFFPQLQLARPAAPAHGVRRLGCAAGHHRRRAVLLRDDTRLDEAATHRVSSSARSATATSSPSAPPSSRSASTERSSAIASPPRSRTTTRSSKDALVSRMLPPSIGTGTTSRLENLGEVTQQGLGGADQRRLHPERRVRLGHHPQRLDRTRTSWSASAACRRSSLSSTQQQREGYPLNGWWSRRCSSYQRQERRWHHRVQRDCRS